MIKQEKSGSTQTFFFFVVTANTICHLSCSAPKTASQKRDIPPPPQQKMSGSDLAHIPPTFKFFFLTYMDGCALLTHFISHSNTKHVNLPPYGASCTPCGGHRGTQNSFQAPPPPPPKPNLQQNGPSRESAVWFGALGQMSFSSVLKRFNPLRRRLTSDTNQTVKTLQSPKCRRLRMVVKNIYAYLLFQAPGQRMV